MPILKQAKKAVRGDSQKRVFNDRIRKIMRASIKELNDLVKEGKQKEAAAKMPLVQKTIDKAVKAGVIKKNTAARMKARISNSIKKLK